MTWMRALLTLTILIPWSALAGEAADRVRVDLDFDQLGIADGSGGPVVVEIHCRGGHPLHQVRMEGDVLVVQTRSLPDARAGALDVSAAQGIGVSFDGRAPAAPAPPAPPRIEQPVEVGPEPPRMEQPIEVVPEPPAPPAATTPDDMGFPPTLDRIPPPWEEGSAPAAPTPPRRTSRCASPTPRPSLFRCLPPRRRRRQRLPPPPRRRRPGMAPPPPSSPPTRPATR